MANPKNEAEPTGGQVLQSHIVVASSLHFLLLLTLV